MSSPVTYTSILAVAILLAFTSCTKKSPGSCNSSLNTVMVTDGSIYCAGGNGDVIDPLAVQDVGVLVQYFSPPSLAYQLLDIYVGENNPFSLNIQDSLITFSSLVAYNLLPADSNVNFYAENFSGGQFYKIVGGTININNFDSSSLTANFTLHLSNPAGSKTISGVINANHLFLR